MSSAEYEVEAIIDKRTVKSRVQYLIQWRGLPGTEATWEPRKTLVKDGLKPMIDSYERGAQRRAPPGGHEPTRRATPPHSVHNLASNTVRKAAGESTGATPSGRRLSRTPARGSSARRRRDRTPLSDVEDEGPTGRSGAGEEDEEDEAEGGSEEEEKEQEQSGEEGEPESSSAEGDAAKQAPIPSYHDVSEAVSESLSAVILGGVLVVGALLHGMVNVLVRESVHSDVEAINQALEVARIATALLPPFAALYTVLSARGHSEPYAKWTAIGLVWYVCATAARIATADAEWQELVDQLDLASIAISLFAFALALTQTDGKEDPNWSLASASIPVACLSAGAYVMQEKAKELPNDKLIILVVFSLLFANLLWRAIARLGLGARSWTSELSVPQWFGLLGAVAITLVDGFHVLKRLDLVHDSDVKQEHPATEREGLVLDFELYLYWIQTMGMAGFALSAILSRKRSFV